MAAVLLLHGIPGSACSWQAVRERLEPQHQVLAPDLLGFGGQPRPEGADRLLGPSQARHVLDVLDGAGVDRAVVVGHDFGGPVAAHLVTMAPERVAGLGLLATNAFGDTHVPFPLSTLRVPLLGAFAERLLFSRPSLAMMVRRGLGCPTPDLDLRHYLGDRQQQAAIAEIFAASLRRLPELYGPVEAALRTVAVPALVGWGDRDPFFPVSTGERTAAVIPGARFRLYPGAGHFLPDERPGEVADDLLDLLALAEQHRPAAGP